MPTNEAQIIAALDADVIVETHQLEIKRDAPASKAERSEIARDLASMALDGGAFLFGLEEQKDDQAFRLAAIDLPGRVEALEQIAELRIDPPLTIRAREIPSTEDPTRGYLHVLVEASPLAPHMVDGVYYGRGEKRRRRLGDAEVLRLHKRRVAEQLPVLDMLEVDVAADPILSDQRQLGHLFIVASPATASPTVAEPWVWDRDVLFDVFQGHSRGLPREAAEWAPRPGAAHRLVSRSHGQAWTSLDADVPTSEGNSVDVEFREDGSIHVFVGRLTDLVGRDEATYAILDGIAVAYVLRTINWALTVAERSSYSGSWYVAVAGTKLKGAVAASTMRDPFLYDGTTYPSPTYIAATQATRTEMQEQPGVVAGRVLNRFVRALRLGPLYGSVLGWDE